jgi:hypothetical protein
MHLHGGNLMGSSIGSQSCVSIKSLRQGQVRVLYPTDLDAGTIIGRGNVECMLCLGSCQFAKSCQEFNLSDLLALPTQHLLIFYPSATSKLHTDPAGRFTRHFDVYKRMTQCEESASTVLVQPLGFQIPLQALSKS